MEPGEALALLESMDKELLDSPAVTKEIIGDRPNTYTFTKVENYSAYTSLPYFEVKLSCVCLIFAYRKNL